MKCACWQKFGLWMAVLGSLLCCGQGRSQRAIQQPDKYTLIEAETVAQGTVITDKVASGGKYVHREGDYQPLILASVPSRHGDSLTVWVRYRGVGVQLKGVDPDGKQRELPWLYDRPRKFTWASFGTFTRSQLGSKILLICAPGGNGNSGVDAIVFAGEKDFDPKTALPAIPAAAISVHVSWETPVARATRLSYGLNAFHGFDPSNATNVPYNKNMTYMNPGLVRLHNWDMLADSAKVPDGWLDYSTHTWDAAKIRAALNSAYSSGTTLLINIPGWPSWMDKDHDDLLDPDQFDNYAQLCADLVKIVNKDLRRHVVYWEITNERDGAYYASFHAEGGKGGLKDASRPDKVSELITIYNRCALAMKRIDPTIKTGGPAVARPDFTDFITRFVQGVAPNLDFFSYHAYASGSRNDSDDSVFDHTEAYGTFARSIRAILKKASPQRPIPAFLDEYNISWTWETRDPRMADNKGAVYDALVLAASVRNGVDGTTAWNDKDGIYGKTDGDDHLRLPAHSFSLFNTYGIGDCVEATSEDPQTIVAYAVKSPTRYALWIINRSDSPQAVTVACADWKPLLMTAKRYEIAASGFSTTPQTWANRTDQHLTVPAFSVTLYTLNRE